MECGRSMEGDKKTISEILCLRLEIKLKLKLKLFEVLVISIGGKTEFFFNFVFRTTISIAYVTSDSSD